MYMYWKVMFLSHMSTSTHSVVANAKRKEDLSMSSLFRQVAEKFLASSLHGVLVPDDVDSSSHVQVLIFQILFKIVHPHLSMFSLLLVPSALQ